MPYQKYGGGFHDQVAQRKKFFEFRDRIMGMSNRGNIAEVQKVSDEIAQKEDLENGQTSRGLESNEFTQT